MAVTRTVDSTIAYTSTPSGTMVAVGTEVEHYKVPYVEGMEGEPFLALVAAETPRDGMLVTYLPHEDVFDITVPLETPGEMEAPLEHITDPLEDVYADYIGGLGS